MLIVVRVSDPETPKRSECSRSDRALEPLVRMISLSEILCARHHAGQRMDQGVPHQCLVEISLSRLMGKRGVKCT